MTEGREWLVRMGKAWKNEKAAMRGKGLPLRCVPVRKHERAEIAERRRCKETSRRHLMMNAGGFSRYHSKIAHTFLPFPCQHFAPQSRLRRHRLSSACIVSTLLRKAACGVAVYLRRALSALCSAKPPAASPSIVGVRCQHFAPQSCLRRRRLSSACIARPAFRRVFACHRRRESPLPGCQGRLTQ